MDNETKIAQELASKLPQSSPQDYSYPEPEQGDNAPQPESGLPPQELEDPFQKYQTKQEVIRYFAIPNGRVNDLSGIVDQIIDFAKRETGSYDLADILQYLHQTEQMIGSRNSGERLNKMRQFAVIRSQRRLLEQKERILYG